MALLDKTQTTKPQSTQKTYGGRLNIDKIKYNFDQGARANRFNVDFFCPPLGINFEGLRVLQCSLPGRQLETQDFSEYGITRKMPFQVGNDGGEVTFTFLCDSTFADRFVIEAWNGAIFDGKGPAGNGLNLGGSAVNPQFRYYNDYIGEVHIQQITHSDKDSLKYVLYEAYPLSFAPMELDSGTTDDIMKFECTFAFRTFSTEYANPSNLDGLNRGRRILDAITDTLGLFGSKGRKVSGKVQKFSDRLAKISGIFD